jgi:acyl-CoA synthetase (AMP-forming)/AMP-acid ligase II
MKDLLVDMVRRNVDRSPDAEAIVHRGRRVRYGELWSWATALAQSLRQRGLEQGDRVALLLENSPEYVAAYYGVLIAGGVVVALNSSTKARDLSNWINHSNARWLIADAGHPELPETMKTVTGLVQLITVDDAHKSTHPSLIWHELSHSHPEGSPDVNIREDDLAAIIYTSGTTGKPKGVTLTHRNLAANVNSILAYLGLTANDRVLNVLPFYYSYGNSVLHTHLAVGGSLVLVNSLAYPHHTLTLIATERVTGFSGVPSTYALIMSRVGFSDYDLSSLRYLTQAGGAMPPAHIQRVRRELSHVKFFVMYGQTEATARLTYLPPERLEEKLGSVGVPIPDVALEIRSEAGEVLEPGIVGEIYARGPNIMQGYWKDPQTTAEVLHNGWLKTGDLAYRDQDGFVYIQGRASDMIKSGAHRINPKDIEEVIAELPEVAEVAVVGVDDEMMGQTIKAVIVPREQDALTVRAIKAHCHTRLASYKIPRDVEFVTQLPKTASGKVKRFLLTTNVAAGH